MLIVYTRKSPSDSVLLKPRLGSEILYFFAGHSGNMYIYIHSLTNYKNIVPKLGHVLT